MPGGATEVAVNQQQNGGVWNLLGTFSLAGDGSDHIELSDQANGYVIADAIQVVSLDAAPNSATWTPGVKGSGLAFCLSSNCWLYIQIIKQPL